MAFCYVDFHTPVEWPPLKCSQVLLQLRLVVDAVDDSVQEATVSEKPAACIRVHNSWELVDVQEKEQGS